MEAVVRRAHLERRAARRIRARRAVLLRERDHAEHAPHTKLAVGPMDLPANTADVSTVILWPVLVNHRGVWTNWTEELRRPALRRFGSRPPDSRGNRALPARR